MTSLDWNSLKNTCLKTGENIPLTIDEIHAQSLALNPSASVPATTASFSLLSATERTDINVWINHSIDSIIIDSINNVADRARKNAKIHLSQLVDSLWDTQKSRFLSELLAPSHSRRLDRDFMLVQKTGLTPRMKSYAALISSLNKSNLKNIFKKMASGLKDLVTDASLGQILDCWNLGSCLFEQNSTVVEGGRRFLGDQFFKYVSFNI